MNKKEAAILRFWMPVFLWMIVIFAFSSLPGEDLPEIKGFQLDKLAHFAEFFVLSALLVRAFLGTYLKPGLTRVIILSIIIASLYGATDEWHQYFTQDRTPDFFDLAFDFIGSSVGAIIYRKG